MFMWDKKKTMQTILASRKPSGERSLNPTPMKNEVVKDENGELDGRHLAAQEMIGAFHEKSPEKLMESLANFIDMHQAKPKESETEG